jgi:AcrR family transcriptional regulator
MPGDRPKRRRRKPEAAESEILDAAESFLKERPFREMTVDDVMSRTGLSRPSFYEYFRDRHHLVMKLAERLGDWTYAISEPWLGGGEDSEAELRAGIERLVALYRERGHLLRALADAARQDKQVEGAYQKFIDRFIDATAARIRVGLERGAMKNLDPEEVATALVLLNERYLIDKLPEALTSTSALIDTLSTVWTRVLYGA